MAGSKSGIDKNELRRVLGGFLTGVTVVTTYDAEGRPRGLTANSFTSISLDPALVLVCIGDHASSYDSFCAGSHFAVNVLSAAQQETSALFASNRADKFDVIDWHTRNNGAPLLDDALVSLECDVHDRRFYADHMILVGAVRGYRTLDGAPLGFFRGKYVALDSPNFPNSPKVAGTSCRH
ncbi:flavin reductase family protein [Limibacillus halophilus]|uniref:Flavin reductase (DIM6/NTAB) family NADH-FMN oxidoreductase RutF n=1 Tax=Limibacillus halophilus TaxID=1579333 RepID=A0A839SRD1_9PROT|nr:flavin reductase family protein [Limibacillus halophilus]MBB3064519.1 flavin reductase (DIM6/NTAB) family NADH-FMN oxidoreductase RutF [Limibacillus halophilus]